MIYRLGNLGMHLLHMLTISFSMLGWVSATLRPWHLLFQGGILASWLGYGLWDGRWGRCLLTDLHWYLKQCFVIRPTTESYVHYWVQNKFNYDVSENTVEVVILVVYFVTSALSLVLWFQTT